MCCVICCVRMWCVCSYVLICPVLSLSYLVFFLLHSLSFVLFFSVLCSCCLSTYICPLFYYSYLPPLGLMLYFKLFPSLSYLFVLFSFRFSFLTYFAFLSSYIFFCFAFSFFHFPFHLFYYSTTVFFFLLFSISNCLLFQHISFTVLFCPLISSLLSSPIHLFLASSLIYSIHLFSNAGTSVFPPHFQG